MRDGPLSGPAACLKDLQRFLRQDDPETRAAFFKLGQFNVAKTDLVPIIVGAAGDTDLVYNACAPPHQISTQLVWETL